ncbi:MAG TPA: serpin family protein [Polyangiaceae bacterium]|nr:serpin family protein [Polyangiaceae bacterium]
MRTRTIVPVVASLLFTACADSGAPATPDASSIVATATPTTSAGVAAPGSATPASSSVSSAAPAASTKPTPAPVDAADAALAKKLAASSNAFGFDLWKKLSATKGNLVASPASLSIALSMTYGGAGGETATEMAKVLHFTGSADDVMKGAGTLSTQLGDGSHGVTFTIANRLYGEKTYHFEDAFLESTKKAYGAGLEPVDFRANAEGARASINGWVESKTDKRITNLIPQGALSADTRLVLTNAIYFLGDWATPFEKAKTRDEAFSTSATDTVQVPTMHRSGSYDFVAADGAQILSMPYAGGAMRMLVVLPDATDGLGALESQLDAKKVDAWIGAMKPTEVRVALPKFEIDPVEPIAAGKLLQAMGMKTAFGAKADFKKIANPSNAADQLMISEVFHKAFVKVDEKGTEAAAASAVVMTVKGLAVEPKGVEFKADHPFLFLMRDDATGLVLFMGRVANPKATKPQSN